MLVKIALGLLWLSFAVYAFFLAPPDRPDTLDLIIDLSTGKWRGINPLIITLFNLMGIWPILYTSVMLVDGRARKIPAWPFALGSFAVGAFAILPYLVFRQPEGDFTGEKNWILKVWDSRFVGAIAFLGASALFAYGLIAGDWTDFGQQWRSSRFINVMSLDFCLLTLLFPIFLRDDLDRRGIDNPFLFWSVSLVPVLGPALYAIARPPLPDKLNQT
ncbi:DUF2834 domain-containing protein [Pannus brasiliensis CCIBt3594]|uniref:DUF2834 domain-containing protein n=1 Tax=Pannus brasiliensis CCIBt3594 TaxID=1427578 RepID=A0AAW9QNG0_9CHRO